MPVPAGWQSGSHYSTIQALEPYLPADKINLSFAEGLLFRRLEMLVDRQAPAVALFSGPYYFAEQLGFRKVIDTSFMIATKIHGDPYPRRSAQILPRLAPRATRARPAPNRYTHYYKNKIPERFHPLMDTRRWDPGERLVFEPYTRDAQIQTLDWITRHGIFAEGGMGQGRYEDSVMSLQLSEQGPGSAAKMA